MSNQNPVFPSIVKSYAEMREGAAELPAGWGLRAILNDDNLCYLAFHEATKEAIVVDPVREDWDALVAETKKLAGYRILAVIDTHTHADHVSCAADLAKHLGAPLVMSEKAPSRRVDLRVSRDTHLPAAAGALRLLITPGHTADSITPIWGPFIFGGDTLMYGDTGRDDLPGGDPSAHYESLQKIKSAARPEQLMLPNHDAKGGRITNWARQLEVNPSLTQDREKFVQEAGAYVGPSPRTLKESLFENFK